MKKLFTTTWPICAQTDYVRLLKGRDIVVVNTDFLQIPVLNRTCKSEFKSEINIQLKSFNFFVHFATYQKVNPLLITYSAETTHTYRQTLTTSFNFSHPADVLPSVHFGSIPKSITIKNGCCKSYYSVTDRG